MKTRLAVSGLLIITAGACTNAGHDASMASSARQGRAGQPEAAAAPSATKQASRSIWAVVPSAPKSPGTISPAMISGSAVAVSRDTLLASCAALGKSSRVGLVHEGKYRIARKVAANGSGKVCVLRLDDRATVLTPIQGVRSAAGLRPEEPVTGLASNAASSLIAVAVELDQGDLLGLDLDAAVATPGGAPLENAVLVDASGNLVGLGDLVPGANGAAASVGTGASGITADLLGVTAAGNAAGLDVEAALLAEGRPTGAVDPLTVDAELDAEGLGWGVAANVTAPGQRPDGELDIISAELTAAGLVDLDAEAGVGAGGSGGRDGGGSGSGSGGGERGGSSSGRDRGLGGSLGDAVGGVGGSLGDAVGGIGHGLGGALGGGEGTRDSDSRG